MIEVKNVTMDFIVQNENIRSIKEYVVNVLKGKISYRKFRALDNVNFFVKKGQVCGIIGKNGAGKSTLLKIIAGVLAPTEGKVNIQGTIAPMLELGAGFDQDLSARENVYLNGAILGYDRAFIDKKYQEIVDFSGLHDFMGNPVRTFSSGMMMRLAFSIATIVEPEILIVDEILSVGDGNFAIKSEKRMRELMSGGTTVLMVSHVLEQIQEMCNRVIWLDHGKIIMDGNADDVCEAYKKSLTE